MRLAGARVLITGGASGLGLATARLLAERGAATLTLLDLSTAEGEAAASSLADFPSCDAAFICCDVTDSKALAAAFDQHWARAGGCDAVLLNAGIGEVRCRRT